MDESKNESAEKKQRKNDRIREPASRGTCARRRPSTADRRGIRVSFFRTLRHPRFMRDSRWKNGRLPARHGVRIKSKKQTKARTVRARLIWKLIKTVRFRRNRYVPVPPHCGPPVTRALVIYDRTVRFCRRRSIAVSARNERVSGRARFSDPRSSDLLAFYDVSSFGKIHSCLTNYKNELNLSVVILRFFFCNYSQIKLFNNLL